MRNLMTWTAQDQ